MLVLGIAGWTAEVKPAQTPPRGSSQNKLSPAIAPAEKKSASTAKRKPLSKAAAASAASPAIMASRTALEGDGARTVFTLELASTTVFAAYAIADPDRVVIDLENVDFHLPAGTGAKGHGLVSGYRYGLIAPEKARIVLDVTGPVSVTRSELAPAQGASAARLIVEISLAAAAGPGAQATAASPRPPVATTLGAPLPGLAPKPKATARPVIVLDPGHGGIDAGTVGGLQKAEKDVVLDFARRLRDRLKASGRYDVVMTRDRDVFVALDQRVRIAREHHCALFISLHTDSVPPQLAHLDVRGTTVYTLSDRANDAQARALAEKENLSDVIAGFDSRPDEPPEVTSILVDLLRRETSNKTLTFTGLMLDHVKRATALSREPHRQAAFKVLRGPDFPSVLVELGYLSNKDDEKQLVSRPWQDSVAAAVASAVDGYFAKRIARVPY
jgi:N-acetylmuramoyl-L-alanine amidase